MALNAVLTSVQGACPEALSFEAWTLEVLSIDPMDPLDCEVNDLQAGNFKKVATLTAFANGQVLWIIVVRSLLPKVPIIRKVSVGLEILNGNLLAPLLMCWIPLWFDVSKRKSIKSSRGILVWSSPCTPIVFIFLLFFFEAFCSVNFCKIHFSKVQLCFILNIRLLNSNLHGRNLSFLSKTTTPVHRKIHHCKTFKKICSGSPLHARCFDLITMSNLFTNH